MEARRTGWTVEIMNYEYLCLDIGGRNEDQRTELLNEYAGMGWELVCAGGVWWVYMKRRLADMLSSNTIKQWKR